MARAVVLAAGNGDRFRHPSAHSKLTTSIGGVPKVRLRDGVVTAIGKTITPFDALDTCLFVCEPAPFAALDDARAQATRR